MRSEETPVKTPRNWSFHFSNVNCISFVSLLQGRESSILARPAASLEDSRSLWLLYSDCIPLFSRIKNLRLFGIKGLHG